MSRKKSEEINYIVQSSTDLINWSILDIDTFSVSPQLEETDTLIPIGVRNDASVNSANKVFLKVIVNSCLKSIANSHKFGYYITHSDSY